MAPPSEKQRERKYRVPSNHPTTSRRGTPRCFGRGLGGEEGKNQLRRIRNTILQRANNRARLGRLGFPGGTRKLECGGSGPRLAAMAGPSRGKVQSKSVQSASFHMTELAKKNTTYLSKFMPIPVPFCHRGELAVDSVGFPKQGTAVFLPSFSPDNLA